MGWELLYCFWHAITYLLVIIQHMSRVVSEHEWTSGFWRVFIQWYPNTFWNCCCGYCRNLRTTSDHSWGKFLWTWEMTRLICPWSFFEHPGHWPRTISGAMSLNWRPCPSHGPLSRTQLMSWRTNPLSFRALSIAKFCNAFLLVLNEFSAAVVLQSEIIPSRTRVARTEKLWCVFILVNNGSPKTSLGRD